MLSSNSEIQWCLSWDSLLNKCKEVCYNLSIDTNVGSLWEFPLISLTGVCSKEVILC